MYQSSRFNDKKCFFKKIKFYFSIFHPVHVRTGVCDYMDATLRHIELPNIEETQIWEGENESVRSHRHLILKLLQGLDASKNWMLW